ncbi:MAG: response regulator [Nostocaceae cyanobacterium]|nr:response regulator [Nostocaceae cyanobacterium]
MTRILIAEDEARLAAFIEKGLRKNAFVTVVAEDGEQALQMALGGEFSLLLLDLGLPVKDGFAVLKELRASGKEFPIIILTAVNDEHYRVNALFWGANDYVTKPFRFSDLLEKVQCLLNVASCIQG